jgi:hypothetical protein
VPTSAVAPRNLISRIWLEGFYHFRLSECTRAFGLKRDLAKPPSLRGR